MYKKQNKKDSYLSKLSITLHTYVGNSIMLILAIQANQGFDVLKFGLMRLDFIVTLQTAKYFIAA